MSIMSTEGFFSQNGQPLLSSKDRKEMEAKQEEYMEAITSPDDEIQAQIDTLKEQLKKLKKQHGIFSTAGAFGVFPVIILSAAVSAKLADSIKIDSLPNLEDTLIQMGLFALYGLMIFSINHFYFEKKMNECSADISKLEAKLAAMETEKQINDRFDKEIKPVIEGLTDRIKLLESSTRNYLKPGETVRENKHNERRQPPRSLSSITLGRTT